MCIILDLSAKYLSHFIVEMIKVCAWPERNDVRPIHYMYYIFQSSYQSYHKWHKFHLIICHNAKMSGEKLKVLQNADIIMMMLRNRLGWVIVLLYFGPFQRILLLGLPSFSALSLDSARKQEWCKRGKGKAPSYFALHSEAQRKGEGGGRQGAEFMASEVQNNHKS